MYDETWSCSECVYISIKKVPAIFSDQIFKTPFSSDYISKVGVQSFRALLLLIFLFSLLSRNRIHINQGIILGLVSSLLALFVARLLGRIIVEQTYWFILYLTLLPRPYFHFLRLIFDNKTILSTFALVILAAFFTLRIDPDYLRPMKNRIFISSLTDYLNQDKSIERLLVYPTHLTGYLHEKAYEMVVQDSGKLAVAIRDGYLDKTCDDWMDSYIVIKIDGGVLCKLKR